jgi:hypothetical protein
MGIVLFLTLIHGLLILLPPVAVWRSVSRRFSRRLAWSRLALALFGPFFAAFAFSVLVWLPAYSGRCGGWLGETSSCGFGQYAMETVFWAVMGLAMPALLGMLLGSVVLIAGLIRRGQSRG